MPVLTKTQKGAQFTHVMTNLLQRDEDTSPLAEALQKYTGKGKGAYKDVDILLSLTEADIAGLTYDADEPDPQDANKTIVVETPLPRGDRSLIEAFANFRLWKKNQGQDIPPDKWTDIDFDEFRTYRIDFHWAWLNRRAALGSSSTGSSTQSGGGGSGSARANKSPSEQFRSTIKKDPASYPVLKDERSFDDWYRQTVSLANTHDLADVFNQNYVPAGRDEQELFKVKQDFVFSFLVRCLQTDKGKSLIRENDADRDAQKVVRDLVEHHKKSTKSDLESQDKLLYLMTASIGTAQSKWRGSASAFLHHWLEQLRSYEDAIPAGAQLNDEQKRVFLQNAVKGVPKLAAVASTNRSLKAAGHGTGDFEAYKKLLFSTATEYDKEHESKYGGEALKKRTVYMQDTAMYMPGEDAASYGIDTPLSDVFGAAEEDGHTNEMDTMYAFQSDRGFRPRRNGTEGSGKPSFVLPRDAFNQLSSDAKRLWKQMPREMQKIIVEATTGTRSTAQSVNKLSQLVQVNYGNLGGGDDDHDSPPADTHGLLEYLVHQGDSSTSNTPQASDTPEQSGASTPPDSVEHTLNPAALINMMARRKGVSGNASRNVSLTYIVSAKNRLTNTITSLIDRGANGGVGGEDVRVIDWDASGRSVDIEGVDDHRVTQIRLATCGGVANSNQGPVILVFHQYAYLGKGPSIHSCGQIEAQGHDVCDRSHKVGGKQRMVISQGNLTYTFPFSIQRGLARFNLRPYSDHEWNTLPHIIVTSDAEWDPTVLDHTWPDNTFEQGDIPVSKHFRVPFTPLGQYTERYEANILYGPGDTTVDRAPVMSLDRDIEDCVLASMDSSKRDTRTWLANLARLSQGFVTSLVAVSALLVCAYRNQSIRQPQYHKLRPMFAWLDADVIEKTFDRTTQYARIPGNATILHRTYKSAYPALNIPRRDEDVSSDTYYGPVPAIDNGSTMAQVFVGNSTLVTDVYGMKTEKQFVNTLEDNIRERGAMRRLLTDSAKVETSRRALDLLRALLTGAWQSEPDQQNQNPAERRINTIKTRTNILMDRTGSEPEKWLLALQYVCDLLNCTYHDSIGGIPLQKATGQTIDISVFLRFFFNQAVYYRSINPSSDDTTERRGRWVGLSKHVGHAFCYKILDDHTHKIHHCSSVRPVHSDDLNLRLEPIGGERDPIIKSLRKPLRKSDGTSDSDTNQNDKIYGYRYMESVEEQLADMESKLADPNTSEEGPQPRAIMTPVLGENGEREPTSFHPDDLIGRTFLHDQGDTRNRLRIVESIIDHEADVEENPTRIKYKVKATDDTFEDMMTYAEVLEHIEKQEQHDNVMWRYKRIVSHQGPLRNGDQHYKGSSYNVKLEWEDGTMTYEPLHVIAADDPVTCAIYAKEKGLLETDGWKRFKRLATRTKKFIRAINQAKLRSYNTATKYKYGYEVPKRYADAVRIDTRNGNTMWQDAIDLEMGQLDEYETFRVHGKTKPDGYKQIKVHLVFDVKHDGRHKARMVADGHLTDIPLESVYSGVVSIRGIRIVSFLSELNDLDLWQTDIGNAYLEARSSERNCILAGPEFGPARQGKFLIIVKALYGLRTSGKMWHIRFAECLKAEGFEPCKAEPDVWLRKATNKHGVQVYEYVAVYVDDLMMAMVNPKAFETLLREKYKFKLKGTGPVTFHLGMEFSRGKADEDKDKHESADAYEQNMLTMSASRYLNRMFDEYRRHFGKSPTERQSPLEPGDHPELDESVLLEGEKITLYQSLIGSLQWAVTIGRLDILTAVVTMSSFSAAPRQGHLERLQRIYGYLARFKSAAIRVRTEEPDFSMLPDLIHKWDHSVYGNPKEEVPSDAPTPLGKYVQLTHYVDANLLHNVLTGKSLTGVLHFANQTPVDWYSKKQSTVETATFGSEIVAARTATEQIIDLRNTMRYLGVPIRETSYLFGDNKTVVDSTMTPHSKLNKRHTMLSYHRVRHAIASGYLMFYYIPGSINPADILSKHWAHNDVYTMLLRPLLFWRGDVGKIPRN